VLLSLLLMMIMMLLLLMLTSVFDVENVKLLMPF